MACITAETATMVFAIINICLVTLSTTSSLGVLIFWALETFSVDQHSMEPESYQYFIQNSIRNLALILGWLSCSLLGLVFSSFLVNGSIKKKPQHIKAYYIYGVLKICFSALAIAVMFIGVSVQVGYPAFLQFPVLVALGIGFSLYGAILHMLRHTYKKMEVENNQFSHQPLQNDKC